MLFASPPTQDGYTAFLEATLPLLPPPAAAPVLPGPDVIQASLCEAMDSVNGWICFASSTLYVEAVYNFAADRAVYLAQDAANQTYWQDIRKKYRIGDTAVGVVSAASNQATSMAQINADTIRQFTLSDIQSLKTPYGRRYLEIAMSFGPALTGVS
jgi:hypothetical protein